MTIAAIAAGRRGLGAHGLPGAQRPLRRVRRRPASGSSSCCAARLPAPQLAAARPGPADRPGLQRPGQPLGGRADPRRRGRGARRRGRAPSSPRCTARTTATRQWLQNLRARASDGVIFVTSDLTAPVHAELRRLNIPVVVIDPAGGAAAGRADRSARPTGPAACSATEHLIAPGPPADRASSPGRAELLCSRARLDGYRAALEAAGLPADDDADRAGRLPPRVGLRRRRPAARPGRPADRDLRLQRPDGAGRVRGGPAARPAGARRPQRGRLRRPAGGALVVARR